MRIAKRRSKKLKKLEEEHTYLDNKVKQLTKDTVSYTHLTLPTIYSV